MTYRPPWMTFISNLAVSMFLRHDKRMIRSWKRTHKGFTLLEIVIAIAIVSMMAVLLSGAFSPYLQFRQRMETNTKLMDLKDAMTQAYHAHSFFIDDEDRESTAGFGAIVLEPAATGAERLIATSCASFNGVIMTDTADSLAVTTSGMSIQAALAPLEPYARQSISSLSKDGYGNAMCVFVSRRANMIYQGQALFYHAIAFVSPGQNNVVDPNTTLTVSQPNGVDDVWALTLGGDDKGILVDGSRIAIENFKKTKVRLDKFARAYETYFKTRFQSRRVRDPRFNYFYASIDPSNSLNGEPRYMFGDNTPQTYVEPTAAGSFWAIPTRRDLGPDWVFSSFSNVIDTGLWFTLGINDSDILDAWGSPILVDNLSPRVRAGIDATGQRRPPPFSAMFGALLPGVSSCTGDPNEPSNPCPYYLISTAISAY